jgi:predicted NUDIX family phosphoesterase
VEFFVDGVEGEELGVREAERELEEEVWVSEERFVDVEGWGLLGSGGKAVVVSVEDEGG